MRKENCNKVKQVKQWLKILSQYKKRMKTVKLLHFSKLEQVLKKNPINCSKAIYEKIQYIGMNRNTSICNVVSQQLVIMCEVLKPR